MKNQHAISINRAMSRGVDYGAMTMSLITLIACENVLPDYVAEEQLKPIYEAIEREMQRIWGETVTDKTKADQAAEQLIGTVDNIRLKRGMEYIQW